jgi:ElaB/YqjD/DUF883 family membrane-anchored ribosome-binding protein
MTRDKEGMNMPPEAAENDDLVKQIEDLKAQIDALKTALEEQAKSVDRKELRRFLTKEAKKLGFARDADLEALRAEGARAIRMVRRRPGTALGLAAAIGFCTGLVVSRR